MTRLAHTAARKLSSQGFVWPRKQDLSALALHYLGCSKLRMAMLRRQENPAARFVAFHDISNGTVANFRALLGFLKQRTNVISLDDYFARRLSRTRLNVAITFDDGYKGWATLAAPALRELELPAAFFISSGFVALPKAAEADFIAHKLMVPDKTTGGLHEDDVRRLAEAGFTIGGHTVNHCNLAEVHHIDKLKEEITMDKSRLEDIIGGNVKYFAYPLGACRNPRVNLAQVLNEAGYSAAVTTQSGVNTEATNPYLLHRELTDAGMPRAVFAARVLGSYDAVAFVRRLLLGPLQRLRNLT